MGVGTDVVARGVPGRFVDPLAAVVREGGGGGGVGTGGKEGEMVVGGGNGNGYGNAKEVTVPAVAKDGGVGGVKKIEAGGRKEWTESVSLGRSLREGSISGSASTAGSGVVNPIAALGLGAGAGHPAAGNNAAANWASGNGNGSGSGSGS